MSSAAASRRSHISRRCASFCATTASITAPSSNMLSRIDCNSETIIVCPLSSDFAIAGMVVPTSTMMLISWLSSNGAREPGIFSRCRSMYAFGMYSNASTAPPVFACRSLSNLSASARERTATIAVAYARGFVANFKTAAVTIPRLPSAPMIRLRRL